MKEKLHRWFWWGIWIFSFPLAALLPLVYSHLPTDGATGDLESFTADGYRVQWLLEARPQGLKTNDLIVRAGGYPVSAWLEGTAPSLSQPNASLITYDILRDGQMQQLTLQLAPTPLWNVVRRWLPQILGGMAFFLIGTLILWRRPPDDLAAHLLMLFCIALALQFWGDAYNFQFSTLLWRWPFGIQFIYEYLTYSVNIASICCFALVFPKPNPYWTRFPRFLPLAIYLSYPIVIAGAMLLVNNPAKALNVGSDVCWALSAIQILLALFAGAYSVHNARDPVTRTQTRWIVWCASVGFASLFPTYVIPLVLGKRPLLTHPVLMVIVTIMAFCFTIVILRYRMFDIDIVINRSLVYSTLMFTLALLYVVLLRALTLVAQYSFQQRNTTLVVFVASLSTALAFDPLRQRIQRLIDQVFYRAKLDYQRMLQDIGQRLATSVTRQDLATLLTEELPRQLQIAGATLSVLNTKGTRFIPLGTQDFPPLPVEHALIQDLGNSRPLMRYQPPPNTEAKSLALLEHYDIALSIPLTLGKRMVGIYHLGPKRSGDIYNREETHLLHLLGYQAAIAVENSRLFQAEREQRQFAEALAEAASVLSHTLDLDQVLDHILVHVARFVGGDVFSVMLLEDNLARVVRARGYEQSDIAEGIEYRAFPLDAQPPWQEVVNTGAPVIVTDPQQLDAIQACEAWTWLQARISAPIHIEERVIGIINVDSTQHQEFTTNDAQRLNTFAHYAAAALENAQLYEQAQLEIAERARASARARASLREKEILLHEIHHRVKNNLQIISSLLNLQSSSVTKPDVLDILRESRNRVRSMALIHEKLYQTSDLSHVDFAEYVRSLANYLLRAYRPNVPNLALTLTLEPVLLTIEQAVPCGLILNELVTNALKYAFPDNRVGELYIELHCNQSPALILRIQDDGIGLPPDLDPYDTSTLGLQLVCMLVEQLEGQLTVKKTPGAHFEIVFNVAEVEE